MVRIGLRKEQIKSIILCTDREFKRRSISFLINSAFAGEKFSAEKIMGALEILDRDHDVENFIFDATATKTEDLSKDLDIFQSRLKNSDLRILIYLDEKLQAKDKDLVLKILPKAHVFFTPAVQAHFNKAFHGGRTIPPPPPGSEGSEKPVAALNLVETSAHIKETVELLNSVAKDKTRLDIVLQIGQKFNGIIGAFAFFAQKNGYSQVKQLASMIDDIARTYQNQVDGAEISEEHWQLLKECAKCLYMILKNLRENVGISAKQVELAAGLLAIYQKDDSILKRQSQSQADIDQLLENMDDLFKVSG